MAEQIEMLFRLTRVGLRKHEVHWRHLANTTEPSMCSSYEAVFTNYSDHVLLLFEAGLHRLMIDHKSNPLKI